MERRLPRSDILRRHLRHGNHVFIQRRLIARHEVHRHKVGNPQLGFLDSSGVAGDHRDAAQHGFHHNARPRFGPNRRNEHNARLPEKLIDIVHGLQNGDVRLLTQRGAIPRVSTPSRYGRELKLRHALGERHKDVDSFHRAGIDNRDEGIVETAQVFRLARFHRRNGHVCRIEAAPFPDVIRHVLAHADNSIRVTQHFRFRRADHRTVRPEWNGNRRADEVDETCARSASGEVEQQQARVVRRRDDNIRIELLQMRREIGAPLWIERQRVDVHAVKREANGLVSKFRPDIAPLQIPDQAVVRLWLEFFEPRYGPNPMPTRGQRFHQQPVRFVAAPVRREI